MTTRKFHSKPQKHKWAHNTNIFKPFQNEELLFDKRLRLKHMWINSTTNYVDFFQVTFSVFPQKQSNPCKKGIPWKFRKKEPISSVHKSLHLRWLYVCHFCKLLDKS